MIGMIILIVAVLAGWAAYCILERLPRIRVLPSLYVIVASNTPNVEWLIRFICRQGKSWRLMIVCPPLGEERRILDRLCSKYGFEILESTPTGVMFKLEVNKKSTPRQLKRELNLLAAKAKREEKPLLRRI